MKIEKLELKNCVSAEKSTSILDLAKVVKEKGARNVLILENDVLVGIVSITDLVSKGFGQDEKNFEEINAEEIMTSPVFVVHMNDEVHTALIAMMKKGLTSCPVVDDHEKCKGMVTINQLIEPNES
jgi:signal-transduction protein with cAMP-binding, CBS, and nucleotidyltransferase domain